MDIFTKHFTMLKENEAIFERYKNIGNIGIVIPDKLKKDMDKKGKELLTIEKSEQLIEVRSIHYYNVVTKTLNEYTFPEWLVCLSEKVLLEYAVPIFSKVLSSYPMLCGMKCEWQVLYEITRIDSDFWKAHQEWKTFFYEIIDRILKECEAEAAAPFLPEEYVRQFECFKRI